jgi:hypothetical protein
MICAAVVVIAAGAVLLATTWMPWGEPEFSGPGHRQSGWDIYNEGFAVGGPNLGGKTLTVRLDDPDGTIYTAPVIASGALAYVAAGVLLLLGAAQRLRGTPRRRSALPLWTAVAVGILLGLVASAVAAIAIAVALISARRTADHTHGAASVQEDSAMPPPDWYSDPFGVSQFQYWDGQGWSNYIATDGEISTDDRASPPLAPDEPTGIFWRQNDRSVLARLRSPPCRVRRG